MGDMGFQYQRLSTNACDLCVPPEPTALPRVLPCDKGKRSHEPGCLNTQCYKPFSALDSALRYPIPTHRKRITNMYNCTRPVPLKGAKDIHRYVESIS